MHIINVTEAYQINSIINEVLPQPKKIITNIANNILKYAPLVTPMIQLGIIFALTPQTEGTVTGNQTLISLMPLNLQRKVIAQITKAISVIGLLYVGIPCNLQETLTNKTQSS